MPGGPTPATRSSRMRCMPWCSRKSEKYLLKKNHMNRSESKRRQHCVTMPMIAQSRKTTKWSGDRQTFRKRIQNNDSEDDPGSQENNGEDARNVYQRPARTKEQTNRDE